MTVTTNDVAVDVEAEARSLRQMTVADLRIRYAALFGEATRSGNREHLVRRILWRIQALSEGGLSERARRRALELANDADLRVRPPRGRPPATSSGVVVTADLPRADTRSPMPGTVLRREYKGRTLTVRVLPNGFEFEGEVHRSLSAIANRVTGSHWNGSLFFGLAKGATR